MESDKVDLLIKRLGKNDVLMAQKLFLLFKEVFELENGERAKKPYLAELLGNPNFIMYAAIRKNEPVGGLTAYQLPMYHREGSEMFIYDVAIKPEFQRMGIGKRLFITMKEYCQENEIREFFVLAHEEDTHALDFYTSTGGEAEKVVNFIYTVET